MSTELTARTPLPYRFVRLWVSTIIVVVLSMAVTLGIEWRAVVSRGSDLLPHPQGGQARLDEAAITRYIEITFDGVDVVVASQENGAPEIAWGDSFFIYDPERNLPDTKRFPFATIVTKD